MKNSPKASSSWRVKNLKVRILSKMKSLPFLSKAQGLNLILQRLTQIKSKAKSLGYGSQSSDNFIKNHCK